MMVFRAFSHRSFALLWSGQTISRLGDSLFIIALAWWVLQKTGSATVMGIVLICSTIPLLLFLLFGGVAVDRLPRVRVMLVSDLLSGATVALIAYLSFQQQLELWQIFVLSTLFGIVDAFFTPAYTALVPDLVPADFLSSANSLRSISIQLAKFIGPAIAAGLIVLGGTSLAFALDGMSFFISAACLLALPHVEATRLPAEKEESVLQDIRTGISTVLHTPWLWLTLVIACVSTIFLVGPYEAALPLLVKQRFGAQVGIYALLTTLSALGSVSAAFWLGHFKQLRRRGFLTYGAWLFAGLMLLMIGLPIGVVGVSFAFFLQGTAFEILGLSWMSTLQDPKFVSPDLLGRVASIDLFVSTGLLPIGFGLAGIAADRLGASVVFVLCGVIATGLIALGLLHPAIRAVD